MFLQNSCSLFSDMKSPKLSIITVNYKGSEKIRKLKTSLLTNPPKEAWEWIVVDNFSDESELKNLRKILKNTPNTHLIPLAKNLGYGQGNAEGVRFSHGEILAIVNPDIEIIPGIFETLIKNLRKNSQPTLCVPLLKSHDGTVLKNTRRFPNMLKLIKRRLFGMSPAIIPQKPRSIEWAQGSFWVLEKKLFESMNGFDDRFFLFFEDTDFCRRLRKKGGQVLQIPDAIAIHSPNRLSGGNLFFAFFRKTFWIHIYSAVKYFWKWKNS